jgi:tol-pal system protein YbgF
MRAAAAAAGLLLAAAAPLVRAAPDVRVLEGRIAALEQRLAQQGAGTAGYGQVQLVTQIQQLQEEVRTLRGQVEENANLLEQLQKRQRDLYLDLDRRLAGLEGGGAPGTPGSSVAPPSAAAPPTAFTPPGPGTGGGPSESAAPPPAAAPAGAPPSAPPAGADEQTLYRAAYEELRAGRYEAAVSGFRGLLGQYPRGDLADNAQYWIGEAYYVTRQYDQALPEFEKVVSGFPQSPKAADAQLKIGFVHYNRREYARAREALEAVVRSWPTTPAARLAQSQLQRMQQEGV